MVVSVLLQEIVESPVIAVRVDEFAIECAAVEEVSHSMSESAVATAPSQHWKAFEGAAEVSYLSSPAALFDVGHLVRDFAGLLALEGEKV
jgi:hypothetical protein